MIKFISILSILTLSACGGGGGGGSSGDGGGGNPNSFLDPSATQSFALTAISSEGGGTSIGSDTATGNTITLGGVSGTFNSDRDQIDFDGNEGTADIISEGAEYVALFNAKPRNAEPFLGVIGMPTAVPDLPSGSVVYSGTSSARFTIIDGNTGTTFDVKGDVSATVDFDGGSVGLTFDSFDGTSVTGAAAPLAVSDIGTLEIEDAVMADGQFSGGTADFTRGGSFSTDLSLDASVITSGGVFGAAGSEFAGVVIVEDSTADLRFIGGFVAD